MSERTFTVKHVIKRTPWDVYEFFADPVQQGQWRAQHSVHQRILSAEPYTRVEYTDQVIIEIEPEGSDTLVTLSKTHSPTGFVGKALGLFRTAKAQEADLMTNLVRAENAMIYDAI